MAYIYPKAFFREGIIEASDARLDVASSAVLYGLSVYTVFPICSTGSGMAAFRLPEHRRRLSDSARIIGIEGFDEAWPLERLADVARALVRENSVREDVLARATFHVDALVAGTRSRGLSSALSVFLYKADPILPREGARLKTSVWRRVPDFAIPSRAKVNGAYVNSVLAKQDAIDSGYDDAIFLDAQGHVCELSAANIFAVRSGRLLTPSASSDILEGITRRTVLEIAAGMGIEAMERSIDLTELYIADEVFATGSSANVAHVAEIDARRIGNGKVGPLTRAIAKAHDDALHGRDPRYAAYLTAM